MIDTIKKGLGVLGLLGFIGALAFMGTAFTEIAIGHGGDPVPVAWTIEAYASLAAFAVGALGYIGLDLATYR